MRETAFVMREHRADKIGGLEITMQKSLFLLICIYVFTTVFYGSTLIECFSNRTGMGTFFVEGGRAIKLYLHA